MKTVFTAIFGAYDDLKEPSVITPGWEYLCFTDQPLQSKVWKIVQKPMLAEGSQRTARFYKIMFHRHIESEFSLWVDASFLINCNLDEFVKAFRNPITAVKHPVRNCVYKEGQACIAQGKDAQWLLQKQMVNYQSFGLPANHGLVSSGILWRQMSQPAIDFCDIWYRQLQLFSARDQLSFAFAAWKMPIHHVVKLDYRTSRDLIHIKHLHKRLVL